VTSKSKADDLSELLERISLCREDITKFAAEIKSFCATGLKVSVEQVAPPSQFYEVYLTLEQTLPVAISRRAGMIANEIRSCLDGLASQLAIRNKQDPKTVYFPISKSKDIFDDDGKKKIAKLKASD
jgi:hypothetical protein